MEDPRCKIAATTLDDPRGKTLRPGVVNESEDPRCIGLPGSQAARSDDIWCTSVAVNMEDPRCKSWRMSR